MNKYIYYIPFILFVLTSCTHRMDLHPLVTIGKNNFESISFEYEIAKQFQYRFCDHIGPGFAHISRNNTERAIDKFVKEHTLQEEEYLIIQARLEFPPLWLLLYIRRCHVFTMTVVERVDTTYE